MPPPLQFAEGEKDAQLQSSTDSDDSGRRLDKGRAADHLARAEYAEGVGRSLTQLEQTQGGTAAFGAIVGGVLLAGAIGLVNKLLSLNIADPATPVWLDIFNWIVWICIGVSAAGLAGYMGSIWLRTHIIEHHRRLGIEVPGPLAPPLTEAEEIPDQASTADREQPSNSDCQTQFHSYIRLPTFEMACARVRRHQRELALLPITLAMVLVIQLVRAFISFIESPSAFLFGLF